MKKNKLLITLGVISICINIFLAMKLIQVTTEAQSKFDGHIAAISNNSIEIKKIIKHNSFNSNLASERLLKFRQELLELTEITDILSVTNSVRMPYGDIWQYIRFVEQLSKSADYSYQIKYIGILLNDFEKIKDSINRNNYSIIRNELKIIDERYKSNE